MNYKRFLQVAGDFEKGVFQDWCRNRALAPMEELFEDWWNKSFTARDLKKTEKEYDRYCDVIERPPVVEPPNRRSQPKHVGMVGCPECGHSILLLEG